jgi:exopolysaccharide production protein ExoY
MQNSYNKLKRLMDVVMATTFIVVFSPVYIVTAFLIWKEDHHSPIYSHKRVGKNKKMFDFYKFRSMVINADEMMQTNKEIYEQVRSGNNKIKVDPRITKIGKFIRKYSIDEFPQMYNVLKGEMSFIGPRALRPDEFAMYEEKDIKNKAKMEIISTVNPGITGYWQVNGRSDIDFDSRMNMDVFYAKNYSLKLDLKILLWTPLAVLQAKGSY